MPPAPGNWREDEAVECHPSGSSQASPEKSRPRCDLMALPEKHIWSFGYLVGTYLYYFEIIQRPNRIGFRSKRVCFITEYTINVAALNGCVSKCAKVEDVEEVIFEEASRTIGIRMRSRPFAITPDDVLHWNCFYEMPVDLLLFAMTEQHYKTLLEVLRFVFLRCTGKPLPCRPLKSGELWEASLVLEPDGSRVRKGPMTYHTIKANLPTRRASAFPSCNVDSPLLQSTEMVGANACCSTRPSTSTLGLSGGNEQATSSGSTLSPRAGNPLVVRTLFSSTESVLQDHSQTANDHPTGHPDVQSTSHTTAHSVKASQRCGNPLQLPRNNEGSTEPSSASPAHVTCKLSLGPSENTPTCIAPSEVYCDVDAVGLSSGGSPIVEADGIRAINPLEAIETLQQREIVKGDSPDMKVAEKSDLTRYVDSFSTDPHASHYKMEVSIFSAKSPQKSLGSARESSPANKREIVATPLDVATEG